MSDYQIKIADDFDISFGYDRKLVPNFFDKEKYMLHHRNLQLCLRLGLKTKKVHRALEFNQSKWLKQCIKLYAQERIEAEKEWSSKASLVTQEIFDSDLVAIHKIETENVFDYFCKNKGMFNFSNYSSKSKYCDDSNALIASKMKGYMGDLLIEECAGLKQKMHSILARHPSEYEKSKGVNKTVVVKISCNVYKMFCWTKNV